MSDEWQIAIAIITVVITVIGTVWGVFVWAISRVDHVRDDVDRSIEAMRESLEDYLKKAEWEREKAALESRVNSVQGIIETRFDRMDKRMDNLIEYLSIKKD